MNNHEYINLNGVTIPREKPVLTATNRSFCFGDGFFDSMHSSGSTIHHFNDHFERILKGIQVFQLEKPNHFTLGFLKEEVQKLLVKNKLFKGGRARVTIFREEGGKYVPGNNKMNYLIETAATPHDNFVLNHEGLVVDIYPEMKKPVNMLANLKTNNALLFVFAGMYMKNNNLDDIIILNEHKQVAEALSSNFFMYYNNTLHTPPLSDGCVEGVMRKQVIRLAQNNGIPVNANESITPLMLTSAEELFITNSVAGIRWIGGIRQKRFYHKVSKLLIDLLNEDIKLEK